MRGASGVSTYVGLPEQEAFDIEYWLLEEAKLQRMPKPRPLAGKVALITGGAAASARPRAERLCATAPAWCSPTSTTRRSRRRMPSFRASPADAVAAPGWTSPGTQVVDAFAFAAAEFGGIDILVSNAGISSSAPIEETELAMWNRNMDILRRAISWSRAKHSG